MTSNAITEGPLIESTGCVTASEAYVVLYQERSRYGITYCIETGDLRFGHRGTWGRDHLSEAVDCFDSAVEWNNHGIPVVDGGE